MTYLYTHPRLSNDWQLALAETRDADPDVRANAKAAFTWINQHKADPLLFNALSSSTNMKPVAGPERKPSMWLAMPPAFGACAGIVLGLDADGQARCVATNNMAQPTKTASTLPGDFFQQFDALKSPPSRTQLIHDAVTAVASAGHMTWVNQVAAEGQRFRTLPVFLVVMDGAKTHFYASTAVIWAPRQVAATRSFVGNIRSTP